MHDITTGSTASRRWLRDQGGPMTITSKSFPKRDWGKKAAQRVAVQGEAWARRAPYIAPHQGPLTLPSPAGRG